MTSYETRDLAAAESTYRASLRAQFGSGMDDLDDEMIALLRKLDAVPYAHRHDGHQGRSDDLS